MNVDQENISEYEFRELEELYNDKIDINISSLNDLKKLFFISETTLNRIISEREKIGNFKNLNQLYEVPDLNINELKYLIPFLKINTKQNKSIKLHPELKTRFRHKTATETNYYKVIGNNEFYVFNFLKSTDYSDKQIFHYTLNIKLNSFLREIVLGRYYIKFGFGLNFWGPYKIFKSSDLNNIRLSNKHFKPYTLSSETNMMEGFAFEVRHKSFFLKPFYSNSDRDIFSNRLIKSNTTRGFIFGTNNRLANVNFILSESQNQYAEKTEEKLNLGASINFKYKSHSIQSEMVFSQKCLSKIILYKLKLNQRVKISFLHRNFNNLNKNSYSNPVRESSSLKNETANSFGINIKLKKLKINFTSEFYSVSSDKVVNNFISGKEIKIDLSSNLTTELNARLKLNYEKKEEPVLTDVFKQTSHLINYKSSLSFNYRLQPNFYILFKNHFCFSSADSYRFNYANSLIINFDHKYFSVFSGLSIFNADQSLYTYEYDLPGVFSISNLNGNGTSFYILAKYKVNDLLSAGIKYKFSNKLNNFFDMQFSDDKTEFKFQIDLKI